METGLFKEKMNLLKDFRLIPNSISGGTSDPNVEATQPGPNQKAALQDWPYSHRSPLSQHTRCHGRWAQGVTPEPCPQLPLERGPGSWHPCQVGLHTPASVRLSSDPRLVWEHLLAEPGPRRHPDCRGGRNTSMSPEEAGT